MTVSVEEYQQLKKKAEGAKADADRAAGKVDQLMHQLKDEYDCDTVEEAEALLAKMEKERDEAEEAYEKELTRFKEEWEAKLD